MHAPWSQYAFAHSVVLFGVFHPSFKSTTTHVGLYQSLWILSLALSTMYTFSWDVLMDWGLGYRKHGYLRERLMFKRKWIYYGVSESLRCVARPHAPITRGLLLVFAQWPSCWTSSFGSCGRSRCCPRALASSASPSILVGPPLAPTRRSRRSVSDPLTLAREGRPDPRGG